MTRRNCLLLPMLVAIFLGTILAVRAVADEVPGSAASKTLDRQIDKGLYEVIVKGTAIFNGGDPAGCCRLFEGALVSVRPVLAHRPALQQLITEGMDRASGITKSDERAVAMRTVLDRVRDGLRPEPAPAPAKAVTPAPSKKAPGPGELILSSQEKTLLDLTNQERARNKLPPLRPSAQLFTAARNHSANMAGHGKMAHELDGQGPDKRLQAVGYAGLTWGENVAAWYPTPAEAMSGWMNSEGHRANILNPNFTEIGLGFVANQRGEPFYTQVFGTPYRR